jgi:hypothetical protein
VNTTLLYRFLALLVGFLYNGICCLEKGIILDRESELHQQLLEIVKQYSSGLLMDVEMLMCCETLLKMYEGVKLKHDPNTGLRVPEGYLFTQKAV